ncbi:MAG: histidine kinase dimerization/phospho-acceptor domain-containing protein [Desulfomonilaceae bacterium]|nr:histidine kinase dimerization/phospho-acceptor domain-containing protein [Desulfomonilaceae bacterium]
MAKGMKDHTYDFKGLGFSKIGHFKEVRSKIKELEDLNIELAERHNKLEAIINSMSDGLTILDANLKVIYVNKVQAAMFPDVQLVGKTCHEVFFRKEQSCRNCHALQSIRTRETYRGETRMREGGMVGRYYEWTISPVIDPFGRVSQIVLLMRDITQRKEYELKLMQADRMAAIGLLAGSIAHEINNPLTSIAGFAEGLLRRLKKAPQSSSDKVLESFEEYLQIIFDEAYRCKDIIQNLLDYSRKSSDGNEALEINHIIRETISLLRQHAKDHHITIAVPDGQPTEEGWVTGNGSQLKHLFLNIFNLAFKAVDRGGTITTSQRYLGDVIEVVISVTGNEDHAAKWQDLLDTWCFADRPPIGSPINVSVCYSIMQNHNGDLVFESHENGTASFTLRFPAEKQVREEAPQV